MHKQERRFTLSEVHTRVGTMGGVEFDQNLLDVLGVQIGDFVVFAVDAQGGVTVKGEKHMEASRSSPSGSLKPPDVTQASLFPDTRPAAIPKRRVRRR
jgi:hypothetical protein